MLIVFENRFKIVRNAVLFTDQINEYEDESCDEFLMLRLEILEVVIVEVDRDGSCEPMIMIIIWRSSTVKLLIEYWWSVLRKACRANAVSMIRLFNCHVSSVISQLVSRAVVKWTWTLNWSRSEAYRLVMTIARSSNSKQTDGAKRTWWLKQLVVLQPWWNLKVLLPLLWNYRVDKGCRLKLY